MYNRLCDASDVCATDEVDKPMARNAGGCTAAKVRSRVAAIISPNVMRGQARRAVSDLHHGEHSGNGQQNGASARVTDKISIL